MRFVWWESVRRSAFATLFTIWVALLGACGSGGDLGPDPGVPPAITSQPSSLTADDGTTASFNVTATGEGLSYQWQRNGSNIDGATLAIYTTPLLTLANSGAVYTVIITNTAGSATSSPATLTVRNAAARITTQPADTSVLDGAAATFTVVSGGTPPITYQWRRNGTDIAGATAASYVTPANAMTDTNTLYSVVVTAVGGSATSRDARLTVTARPPTVTTQPANASAQYLTGAVFTAQASGTAPLTYRWFRNGIALGNTGTTLSLAGVNYGDDGARYTVVVSNDGGEVTSQSAVLTVTPPPGTVLDISSCLAIGSPGAYRLTANVPTITVPGATCIAINSSNVQLDCAGHSLGATGTSSSAIALAPSIQNVSIKGCTVQTNRMFFDRVTNVSVHDNVFPAGAALTSIEARGAELLTFDNNTVALGNFRQVNGRNVTVSNNRITTHPGVSALPAVVSSLYGSGTRVLSNTLDGRWDSNRGNLTQNGAHAGIIVQDESDVVLEGNTLQDIFACGVEFLGTISAMRARDNRITNAGQCGFFGASWFSMSDSRFVGNTIDRSAIVFHFVRRGGLRPAGYADPPDTSLPVADTAVVFRDVVIERNTQTRALAADGTTAPATIVVMPITTRMDYNGASPPEAEPGAGAFQLGNIRFIGNAFDRTAGATAPMELGQGTFTPGLIVDGGGNLCPRSSAAGFPINCGN